MLQPGVLVGEDRRGFFERDTMLAQVLFGFGIVPRESHIVHIANVLPKALRVNRNLYSSLVAEQLLYRGACFGVGRHVSGAGDLLKRTV